MLATPPERLGFSHASNGSTIPDTDEDGNVVYPEARLEIENGLHQLETLLESTVDKAFDKFEIYVLRNILTVPEDLISWVRLTHYEVRGVYSAGNTMFKVRLSQGLTCFFFNRTSPLIRPQIHPHPKRSSSNVKNYTKPES